MLCNLLNKEKLSSIYKIIKNNNKFKLSKYYICLYCNKFLIYFLLIWLYNYNIIFFYFFLYNINKNKLK